MNLKQLAASLNVTEKEALQHAKEFLAFEKEIEGDAEKRSRAFVHPALRQYCQENRDELLTPPTLGISVSETIETDDQVGGR